MKRIGTWLFLGFLFLGAAVVFSDHGMGAEKKGDYLLLGSIKEGW